MTRSKTELTYLRATVESATPVELAIILFDLLINDLKAAVAALSVKDIEGRSKILKHAFLVLEQMEEQLDLNSGEPAATALARFYSVVRSNLMQAHIKADAEVLNRQIALLFEVRGAWEKVKKRESSLSAQLPAFTTSASNATEDAEPTIASTGSWSA